MSRDDEIIIQAAREEAAIRQRLSTLDENSAETLKELNTLACVLSTQAKYDEAIKLFERVIDLRERTTGCESR